MQPRLFHVKSDVDRAIAARWLSRTLDEIPRGWMAVHPGLPGGAGFGPLEQLAAVAGSGAGETYARGAARAVLDRQRDRHCGLPIGGGDRGRPLVMGIVNVTPDSFSDGGRYHGVDAAVAHAMAMVEQGASILDIGGESTRPRGATYGAGAVAVSVDEEIDRVAPVIERLARGCGVPISIDTRKAAVARAAIAAGATIVNDVSGLRHDPALAEAVATAGALLVLMHTPADIEQLSHEQRSEDVLGDVLEGLAWSIDTACAAGVDRRRIVVDPGLGFGKSLAANRFLLRHLDSLAALGRPILVGASRKRFLVETAPDGQTVAPDQRLGASVAAALLGVQGGASMVRVHDVEATVQALAFWEAVNDALPEEAR